MNKIINHKNTNLKNYFKLFYSHYKINIQSSPVEDILSDLSDLAIMNCCKINAEFFEINKSIIVLEKLTDRELCKHVWKCSQISCINNKNVIKYQKTEQYSSSANW